MKIDLLISSPMMIHYPLKSISSIGQAKGHLLKIKCFPFCGECSLILVFIFHPNLVISRETIKEGKKFDPTTMCKIYFIGGNG